MLPFYLNYVGCKEMLELLKDQDEACFTLTMWDVKVKVLSNAPEEVISFTLTMWDVKFKNKEYYIDKDNSFTLTMWDVKREKEKEFIARCVVLP